ncbi:AAA family ATPase [Archangium lansingense]|uniref:AAA family ATPase n=1 Tax=Archangium lansingense TaxID=2995310 RepID=UPI003B762843
MNENLRQFLDIAEQLAQASGYDGIRIGLVWTNTRPKVVLALSATLVRTREEPPLLAPLDAGPVSASQFIGSPSGLPALLSQLDSGMLEQLSGSALPTPLHLTKGEPSTLSWWSPRAAQGDAGYGTYLEGHGIEIRKLLGTADITANGEIAARSDYAYASLGRLIRAYTGLELEFRHAASIILVAPWPVKHLSARQEATRLRVEVDGFSGLDTSRLILNVEGSQRDYRLDSSTLRWLPGPETASGTRTYTSVFEAKDPHPTAINLFLSQVPAISLREEVQHESSRDALYWGKPETPPAPVASPEGIRLTAFRVYTFRLLRAAELRFDDPFSVIVGPNQSGKSSVLDALQLLSDAARGELSDALVRRRSGLRALQSRGATEPIRLEAELQTSTGQALRFRLQLGSVGAYDFAVEQEELAEYVQGSWMPILTRQGTQAKLSGVALPVSNGREALLSQLGAITHPLVQQARASLAAIAVYPYFRTGAAWADPESIPMRRPARLEPGARLERTGNNLSAALFSLREERPEDWQDYVRIVRLAFPSLKDLRLPAVSRGMVQLFWDEVNGGQFDASELSDGTLSFLTILCALFQPGSALIAVDEPEAHLHPDALMRLVGAARSLSERHPILFTTQSDALIGLLDDAPECVVVARREDNEARLVRPAVEELREWLKSFSLREMRRELEGWGSTP